MPSRTFARCSRNNARKLAAKLQQQNARAEEVKGETQA
jgi:hypothetical protein